MADKPVKFKVQPIEYVSQNGERKRVLGKPIIQGTALEGHSPKSAMDMVKDGLAEIIVVDGE